MEMQFRKYGRGPFSMGVESVSSFYVPPTGFLYFVLFIINDSLAIINVPPYVYLPWPHVVLTLFVWGRRPFSMAVEKVRPSFLVPPNFGFLNK